MDAAWGPAKRISFRFAFVFLSLRCAAMLALAVPFASYRPFAWISAAYWAAWSWLIQFLTEHLLGFTPTGSLHGSDSEVGWLKLLWSAVIAVIATAAWTLVARRNEYRKLADYHRTLVRHALAAGLLFYGLNKVFQLQFWSPSPTDLSQTFGSSSSFGLAWRFLGASTPYTVFSGGMECLAGALLLWRRTSTLGALFAAAVMVNVVMLNFCYAIPVKNFSTTMLALALYLALPEAARILNLFVHHRPITPGELRPFPLGRRGERIRLALKATWIVTVVGLTSLHFNDRRVVRPDRGGALPALWGLYDVEELDRDGIPAPLVITDPKIWQQVAFGYAWGPVAAIVTVDGVHHQFGAIHDEASGMLTLSDDDDKMTRLHVRHLDATHLELAGDYDGQHLTVRLRAHDLSRAKLTNDRFRWVDDGGVWQ